MKRLTTATLVAISIASTPALANPQICTYGDLSRRIEVVYSHPGQPVPCEVIYDKSAEGSIATLWRADHEAGYCEAQAAALAEKLSGMGWSCSAVAYEPAEPEI